MPIRLIAIDLDDTLLRDDVTISPRVAGAIQTARRQGVKIVIATGRMPVSAKPFIRQLELDLPAILYHGALVQDVLEGKTIFRRVIPSSLAGEIIRYGVQHGVYGQIYLQNRVVAAEFTSWSELYNRIASIPIEVGNLEEELAREPEGVEKIIFMDDEPELDQFALLLRESYGDNIHITKSKPFFLEVVDKSVNKGAALAALAAQWGIVREDIMAIGDSYNDLEMIRYAGVGVAMGNARMEIKAQADIVALTNEEDGVAEVLEKYVLKSEVRRLAADILA